MMNMLLQMMKSISHFQGNWSLLALPAFIFSHLSFPPLYGGITVFRRNTNQRIAAGDWSACMGLLLDQIPKTFLPSPKLSLLCNLC